MKLSHASTQLLSLSFILALGSAAIVACAQGAKSDAESIPAKPAPTEASSPTDPADASTSHPSLPPSSDAPSSSDAGSNGDSGQATPDTPAAACTLSPQGGCKANETCAVVDRTTGAVSCVQAGSTTLGSHCAATSDCAAGLTCTHGACRPYCASAGSACTGTGLGACGPLRDSAGTPVPNTNVCAVACDLLDPSKACGTNSCTWDATLGQTDCAGAGTKADGETCTKTDDCKQGFSCVTRPVYGSTCARWCRVGNQTDCTFPATCVNVYGKSAPTQGEDTLGLCE